MADAAREAEALEAIARILGREPSRSVAVLGRRAGGGRFVLRVDLPRPGTRLGGVASSLGRVLCRGGAAADCDIVAYTPLPWAAVLEDLQDGLRSLAADLAGRGVGVRLSLVVASDGWGPPSGPGGPRPLPRRRAAQRGASRPAPLPRPEPGRRVAFLDAIARARGRSLASDAGGPAPVSEVVERALSDAGGATAALAELVVRIAGGGGRDGALACLAWGPHAGGRTPGAGSVAPDEDRVGRAIERLRTAAGLVRTPKEHASLLAAIAWLSFSVGAGSSADDYLSGALSWDPDSAFADEVASAIEDSAVAPWLLASPIG